MDLSRLVGYRLGRQRPSVGPIPFPPPDSVSRLRLQEIHLGTALPGLAPGPGRGRCGHPGNAPLAAVLLVEVDDLHAEALERSVAGAAHIVRPAVDSVGPPGFCV